MSPGILIEAVPLADEVRVGDPLGELLTRAAGAGGRALGDGDVLVVSQKVVSKAEGRVRDLAGVEPQDEAIELARRLDKDPRLVQVVLEESRAVIRAERGVLIVETGGGWVCANGGVDASNAARPDEVTLLPLDADASARRLRAEIQGAVGARPAVVIADSFGRPWRVGQADVAIGCAGLVPLDDWRGRRDRGGRELSATAMAIADEAAAAADLVRAKDEGVPAVAIAGLKRYVTATDGPGAAALRRAAGEDLFR